MDALGESSILSVKFLNRENISYMDNESNRNIAKLSISSINTNEKYVDIIFNDEYEILKSEDNNGIFAMTAIDTFATKVDPKNFVRRIIFSHFNSYLSGEDEEGLYDAEILAYSKYILGVEKLPVVSLTYKDVSPIATCDLDFQGLIDKKGDINIYDARTGKIKDLLGKEIKSQPDQQKLSEIFSKAYSSLYGKNFISSQDKSVVCPIIVLGDSHASVMLIEAIKQEDGTIKYKWESCDSSGYHFNKYFEGYNCKEFLRRSWFSR